LVRGDGGPQLVKINPDTVSVRLRMKVERGSTGLEAVIRSVEGRDAWSSRSIRAQADYATATVPAGRLAAGDYILTLPSMQSSGQKEELSRYFFRITRQ
jgi:hypothetical protein